MDEPYKLKDFFNEQLVADLGSAVKTVWPEFDELGFNKLVLQRLDDLELKERSLHVCDCLQQFLPNPFPEAISILLKTLGEESKSEEMEGMSGFYYMPHSDFVWNYGLEHFEESMNAMYEITKRFTSEFSIRYFLRQHPEKVMNRLHVWVEDENLHVRRLVSEGTRPRLPWSFRLKEFEKDPKPVIELLEKLKDDESLYVRRSVANNLNDIAKDHPDMVVQLLSKWDAGASKDRKWIIRHALRSLLKQGHPEALKLMGYSPDVKVAMENFTCTLNARIGEEVEFQFNLSNQQSKPANVMIDFVVYYMKANGKQSPKVFKLTQKKLKVGEKITVSKKLALVQRTTRKHYPGEHGIAVQVNGKEFGRISFNLVDG